MSQRTLVLCGSAPACHVAHPSAATCHVLVASRIGMLFLWFFFLGFIFFSFLVFSSSVFLVFSLSEAWKHVMLCMKHSCAPAWSTLMLITWKHNYAFKKKWSIGVLLREAHLGFSEIWSIAVLAKSSIVVLFSYEKQNCAFRKTKALMSLWMKHICAPHESKTVLLCFYQKVKHKCSFGEIQLCFHGFFGLCFFVNFFYQNLLT